MRLSVRRDAPYVQNEWVEQTAAALGLESSLRPRGRPQAEDNSAGGTLFS